MNKTNRIYKIFMTTMIVAIAGMLLAMGIIAAQKTMKLSTSIDFLPGVNIELYVKNDSGEVLLFRNFQDTSDQQNKKYVTYDATLCSMKGNTFTMKQAFLNTYGNDFSLIIKNYSAFAVKVDITSTAITEVEGVSQNGIPAEVNPATTEIAGGLSQEFKISCSPVVAQETTLTIHFEEVISGDMLISGYDFNTTIKKVNTPDATRLVPDQCIESIIFDTWNSEYATKFGSWEGQNVVAFNTMESQNDEQIVNVTLNNDQAPIRLFLEDADENGKIENLYILSKGKILANTDCRAMFSILLNQKTITFEFNNFDTSQVELMGGASNMTTLDMQGMFGMCAATSLNLSSWDTSNVKDMSYMFNYLPAITSLNLSGWDTSSVTSMRFMFTNIEGVMVGSSRLESLDVSHFDTSNVTDMAGIFAGQSMLQELNVTNWDTSQVTQFSDTYEAYGSQTTLGVFAGCNGLESLDLSQWDVAKANSLDMMFYRCESLGELDLSSFEPSQAESMVNMFACCYSLKTLDLSNFNTSKVTNMGQMFYSCSVLTSLDLSSFDTSNVTNMVNMFENCTNLKTLDLSNFDMSKVTDIGCMFFNCTSLESITSNYASAEAFSANVTTTTNWLYGCGTISWL